VESGHPGSDAWIVAIHATPGDYEPLCSGVVLDDRRVLTCARVAGVVAGAWVSFPKAEGDAGEARRQVEDVVYPVSSAPATVKDLVILMLAEPVPARVAPASLRCPRPGDLAGKSWWAFGFPDGDPLGSPARGRVESALAHGWVRLAGSSARTLTGHDGQANAVCAFTLDGATLLASGGADGTVRIWDPATGAAIRLLTEHDWVNGVCALTLGGTTLLATAASDGAVRIWDPADGTQVRALAGHDNWVSDVCALTTAGSRLLVTASDDGSARIWDSGTGALRLIATGHGGAVVAVCAFTLSDAILIATAGSDGTTRIWELATDSTQRVLDRDVLTVNKACALTLNGATAVATAEANGDLRVWNADRGTKRLVRGRQVAGSLCAFWIDDTALLASGTHDGGVMVIDPADGTVRATLVGSTSRVGGTGPTSAICAFSLSGATFLASAASDGSVQIWEPASRGPSLGFAHELADESCEITAMCASGHHGTSWLATAATDGTVRVTWHAVTTVGRFTIMAAPGPTRLIRHGGVKGLCAFDLDGSSLLATAGLGTVRIWHPYGGDLHGTLFGHEGPVNAVCAVAAFGVTLLATAGYDRSVRIWDPARRTCLLVIPTRDAALSVAYQGRDALRGHGDRATGDPLGPRPA
jgi:WD40 repeat protein